MEDDDSDFSKGWWAYHKEFGERVSELERYISYLEAKLRVEEKVKEDREGIPPPT